MSEETNIPTEFGDFRIVSRLGAGGMGQVFRAHQVSLDREVALKVLPSSAADDAEMRERLIREARSAAKLVHPNVVQVYAVGEHEGMPYFAMEYVRGEDLSRRLSKGQVYTYDEAVDIISSVVMAVGAGEQFSIVHRDLKPANIMIDEQGVVKVMDFGLAKATSGNVSRITQANLVVGTPTYMAPEQGEGLQVDTRSDIYSVGCILYELLAGRPPFQAENPVGMIYQHIHQEPQPPTQINPECPPALERICQRALAKQPNERYQTAHEMLNDLMNARVEMGPTNTQRTIAFNPGDARKAISSGAPVRMGGSRGSGVGIPPSATDATLIRKMPMSKGVKFGIAVTIVMAAAIVGVISVLIFQEPTVPVHFSELAARLPADSTGTVYIDGEQPRKVDLGNLQDQELPVNTAFRITVEKPGYDDWEHEWQVLKEPITFEDVNVDLQLLGPSQPGQVRVLLSQLRTKAPEDVALEVVVGSSATAAVLEEDQLKDQELPTATPLRIEARKPGFRPWIHEMTLGTKPVEDFADLEIKLEQPLDPILPLTRLRPVLRPTDEVALTTPEQIRRTAAIDLADVELPPGSYKVEIKRRGYEPVQFTVEHSREGTKPEISGDLVEFTPTQRLQELHQQAMEAWQGDGAASPALAAELFRQVLTIDPKYPGAAEALARIEQEVGDQERQWMALFEQAKRHHQNQEWEQAEALLEQIDTAFSRYTDAVTLQELVRNKLLACRKEESKVITYLEHGRLDDAELALKSLAQLREGNPRLSDLRERLKRTSELLQNARSAFRKSSWADAADLYRRYLEAAPKDEDAKAQLARAESEMRNMDAGARLAGDIKRELRDDNATAALAALPRLAELEKALPADQRQADQLREQALQTLYGQGVDAVLAAMDRAAVAADPAAFVAPLHPTKVGLKRGLQQQWQAFLSGGARVVKSEMRRVEMRPKLPSAEQAARGDYSGEVSATVEWEYVVALPLMDTKPLHGTARQHIDIVASSRGDKTSWRVKGLRALAASAVADPDVAPDKKRILATVKRVHKPSKMVLLDRGARQGVKTGMTFNLYSEGKVVKLPITGETLIADQVLVAVVRVMNVGDDSAWAKIVDKDAAIDIGLLAVQQPDKAPRVPPQVVRDLSRKKEGKGGDLVQLGFEVVNLQNQPVHFLWSTDGGALLTSRTLEPRNHWIAPSKAGTYKVVLKVMTPEGMASSGVVQVVSKGPRKEAPRGFRKTSAMKQNLRVFGNARALAFDEQNGPALLSGGRDARLYLLGNDFDLLQTTDEYREDFTRMAYRDGEIYVLDTRYQQVKRYKLEGNKTFGKQEQGRYGGEGRGNGKLSVAQDFCLNADGDILMLDSYGDYAAVQVFHRDGRFVHSYGSAGTATGQFAQPVAICADDDGRAYVLDKKRRHVIVFRDGTFENEFGLSSSCRQPQDISFCRATQQLLILDGAGAVHRHSGTAPYPHQGKFATPARDDAMLAAGTIHEPQEIVCDRTGHAYIICGRDRDRLERFTTQGQWLGRMGGETADSFTKIAGSPDGGFYVLDRSGIIRRILRGGWTTARFGGRGRAPHQFDSAMDLTCDSEGNIYVLDPGSARIKKFDADGRFLTEIGSRKHGLEDAVDLDVGGDVLAVLQPYKIRLYSTAGAAGVTFPARRDDLPQGTTIAVGPDGNLHVFAYRSRNRSIITFTPQGTQVRAWTTRFDRALTDMVATPGGILYTTGDYKLQSFRIQGEVVAAKTGYGGGLMDEPVDVGVDGLGSLYVLDEDARAVLRLAPVY